MEYTDINYQGVGWKDYPSTSTKLNAENLNVADEGIKKLVEAIKQLRTILGDDNLTDKQTSIIAAVNDISDKFGGYYGYNLLNINLLQKVSNGHSIDVSLEELGLNAGDSCTFSMESDNDIYLYECDSEGKMLVTESLTDMDKSTAFTINSACESISVFFPSAYYASENACRNSKVMLEKGTEKHSYEPYTGGEIMTDMWDEILENRMLVKEMVNEVEQQLLTFNDVQVETSVWKSDRTYTDYPYRAAVSCSGIDETYNPMVTLALEDATSGRYAPVAYAGINVVYLYANSIPSDSITIPTIQCIKGA